MLRCFRARAHLYLVEYSLKETCPLAGHAAGGRVSSITQSACALFVLHLSLRTSSIQAQSIPRNSRLSLRVSLDRLCGAA